MKSTQFLVFAILLSQLNLSAQAVEPSHLLGSVSDSQKFDAVIKLKPLTNGKLLASPSEQNAYTRNTLFRNFRKKRAIKRSHRKEADAFCKAVNNNSELDRTLDIPYEIESYTGINDSVSNDLISPPAPSGDFRSRHHFLESPYHFEESLTKWDTRVNRAITVTRAAAATFILGALITSCVLLPPLIPLVPAVLAAGAIGILPTALIPAYTGPATLSYKTGKSLGAIRHYHMNKDRSTVLPRVPHTIFTRISCAPIQNITKSENFVTRLIAKARSKFSRFQAQSNQQQGPNLQALRGQ